MGEKEYPRVNLLKFLSCEVFKKAGFLEKIEKSN